jgi:hypothetical protein
MRSSLVWIRSSRVLKRLTANAEVAPVLDSIPSFSVGVADEAVLNTSTYVEEEKNPKIPLFLIFRVCREPAPDQQPDVGGDHTAAMPGGAGQAGASAARSLEHPPVLPPERRDQGTLCPGRRLSRPPAGKGFFAKFRVRIEVKN